MVFFEYENRKIESFEQFHKLKNEQRKTKLVNTYHVPDKYPPFMRKIAKQSNEMRDYLEYINCGGGESPELMRDILSRCKKETTESR